MKKMTRVLGFVCLVLSFAACARNTVGAFISPDNQGIVNGSEVIDSDVLAHSVVAIVSDRSEGQALCTGSLVSKDTILTAAHCVDGNPTSIKIVFRTNLKGVSSADLRVASAFKQNSLWNAAGSNGLGDLAVVHFDGGAPSSYTFVKLAPAKMQIATGIKTLLMGYGVTDGQTHAGPGVLRKTTTTILQNVSATQVATDGRTSSVCFGDSGGPAFLENNGDLVQWGIASSVSNENCNQISIHTSVMSYLSWIKSASAELRTAH